MQNLLVYSIIVIGWNMIWLFLWGWDGYKEVYTGKFHKGFAVLVYIYLLSGILSFILYLKLSH